ncbi:MAG: beta-lactamase family protein [Robiginitomaculum sp.]|nr:beta-lactamase family protein [Robiginitomaculum sp.]
MKTGRIKKQSFTKFAFIAMAGLVLWLGWPIYGFVSNQFETARLPFGWVELQDNAPARQELYDDTYRVAGNDSLLLLADRRSKIHAPSLSAAVAIDGKLVWAGAVGWQDVKADIAATPTTVYRIGSTSKAVTATGLARLVTLESFDLDAPISTYSSDLPNILWADLTASQLASHTAGLPGYEENTDWIGFYKSLALTSHFNNPKDALSMFDGGELVYQPGSDFLYSSYGTILLSAVMQDASGTPYLKLMNETVFAPLGLHTIEPDTERNNMKHRAVSYQTKGRQIKLWRFVDLSHKLAAGGFVASPSDLARLGAAWLDDDFIAPDVRDDFWEPVRLTNGNVNIQDYAIGWRRKSRTIKGVGSLTHLNHGGISKGSQTWLMIVPEYGISIAISTNRRTDVFFDFADIYENFLEEFIPIIQNQRLENTKTDMELYVYPPRGNVKF